MSEGPVRPRRVLLIGWDAADWQMIDPLIEAGEMPNLRRFVDEGVRGNVATLQPPLSPMLWTSVATGKHADKHGVLGFAESDGVGGSRPVTSTGRSCKALWNMLWDAGRPAGVVNWYASHPAEVPTDGADGFVVTDRFAHPTGPLKPDEPDLGWPLVRGSVWPEGDLEALGKVRVHPGMIGREQVEAFIPLATDEASASWDQVAELRGLLAHCTTVHNAATAYIRERDWDFFGIYYDAIDRFAHAFMEYGAPRMAHVSEADFERYSGVMNACYRYHDLMLGRLMNLVDDETAVVILSDHGFHSGATRPSGTSGIVDGQPAAWHRTYGVLAFWGPGIKKGASIHGATLLDIAPTVLTMLGMPPARDMDGQPLTQMWDEPSLETRRVETYEDGPARRFAETEEAGDVDSRVMRQLQDLGYVGQTGEADIEFDRMRNLAAVYASTGRLRESVGEFEKMLVLRPDDRGTRMGLASTLMNAGRLGEAERVAAGLDDGEEQDGSQRARTLALRGMLASARGDNQAALGFVLEAQRLDPGALWLDTRAGVLQLSLERYEDAERSLLRALDRDGDDAEALDAIGRVYRATGRASEAVYSHMRSISLIRQRGSVHLNLALALIDVDRMGWAIEALAEAARLMPVNPEPHRRLARLYKNRLKNEAKAGFHAARAAAIEAALASKGVAAGAVRPRTSASGSGDGLSVVVVSGLPRSGTSLMMRAIEAGGGSVLVDDVRGADEDNPRGYYELEAVKQTATDPGWLLEAPGRAVKMVHSLLRALPGGVAYDVVFMKRDLDEVVASQAAMLERMGRSGGRLDESVLRAAYSREYERIGSWLSGQEHFRVLEVSYNRFVSSAQAEAERVCAFLGSGGSGMVLDAGRMASCVEPGLYRQRKAAD